jgi:hypothetical protein
MPEPIDNLYFNWLYTKVCDISARTPQLQFKNLLRELHHIEFTWVILGDDNRAEDGCDLRRDFLREMHGAEPTDNWLNEGCSVLEMLVAFSRQAAFQTDEHPKTWFWIMLENLQLSEFNDARRHNPSLIRDIVETFVWRTYDPSGEGGLFPLQTAQTDQREVEIWYQFSGYVLEREFA